MMDFIPDETGKDIEVPFLDDARADDGWQGHSSRESIQALRAQISGEIGRMGGSVTRFQRGKYVVDGFERPGVEIEYQVASPSGQAFIGQINVAGLPWQEPYGGKKRHAAYENSVETRREKSRVMALYNVREALRAMRILQILSPGYAALIPWLIAGDSGKTLGEMWGIGSRSLPAPSDDGDAVEAEFREVE